MSRPVAILRPEPGNSLTVQRAERSGIDNILSVPLFKVRPVDWEAPDPDRFDAMLMTSANAARHGGDALKTLRDLPVHCVGEATAAAARAAGMMIGDVGDGGIDELLGMLPADLRLLHLGGRHRRTPEAATQTIVPLTIYSSVAREEPRGFEDIAGSIACIHSPRAARRLAELVDRDGMDRSGIAVVAISDDAAEPLGEGWEHVAVATAPRDAELLACAKRLCEKVA
ncbi:uroporphyrinogen-III synthase [Sphingomicrobium sediminis]|uniref:Uroporphyrinogen-III synthase n=1 Tax=Sphingomicrobium sediminis TaxID=2950949 RepID=A0A9X2J291_9SPHN|nr:uroporphyrinogen-III synthase [Sphingomicrobium sediminis]MCM8558038.1 uroporphyrinogen-III synthase [Sphingomicrobium sediminis]